MSALVTEDVEKIEITEDVNYFIACIIPYLPFEDESDQEIEEILKQEEKNIKGHPIYATHKVLFGTKHNDKTEYVENFDKIVMRMLLIYFKKMKTHKQASKKGGRRKIGGGEWLRKICNNAKLMVGPLQMTMGIFLLFVATIKTVEMGNRDFISTTMLPTEMAYANKELTLYGDNSVFNDDYSKREIMYPEIPKIDLTEQVQKKTSIKLVTLLKAAFNFKTDIDKIVTDASIIFENEALKQSVKIQEDLFKLHLPLIKKDTAEKFLGASMIDVELEDGSAMEVSDVVFNTINEMKLTDKIFNWYKFSFTGRLTDLLRATKSAVSNFKKRVATELDIMKDDAIFKAESYIIDLVRDNVTIVQLILAGITFLMTGYASIKYTGKAPLNLDELDEQQKDMLRDKLTRMLRMLDNSGPVPEQRVTRSERRENYFLMDGEVRGGRKRRIKKTRKKRRKTRRKSKKRKSKRRRRKRKKTRKK